MADKKISQLDLAAQINNDAVIPMSQENGGEQTTYKALITAVAAKIGEGTTFSNLNTNAKNLVGAINEIEAGGGGGGSSNANLAPDYDSTSTYAVGDWCIYNGTLYQCNTAIPTAEAFDPTHWTAKKVVDAFADIEDELDDKVDTTDFLATNLPISSGSATNTKDYIDNKVVGTYSQTNLAPQSGVTINDGGYCVIGNMVIVNIRFTLSSTKLSGSSLIHGFPSPIATANNISCSNSGKINMPLNTSGQIIIGEDLGSGTYIASCVYLKV